MLDINLLLQTQTTHIHTRMLLSSQLDRLQDVNPNPEVQCAGDVSVNTFSCEKTNRPPAIDLTLHMNCIHAMDIYVSVAIYMPWLYKHNRYL